MNRKYCEEIVFNTITKNKLRFWGINVKKIVSMMMVVVLLLSLFATGTCAKDNKTFKNVILMIGDGMGENSINWTKAERNVDIFMDTLPYQGYSMTDSYSGTTDSAAGGTALSSGYRAINSNLGVLGGVINNHGLVFCTYTNSCEIAKELDKKAGIVTSDENCGATPSAFSVHVPEREMSEEICKQQLACNLDLIWARSSAYVTEEAANKAGWTYLDSSADIEALEPGTKSFGQFGSSVDVEYSTDIATHDKALLSYLTEEAIEQLDNDNGFFLMVEGAHIDKNSHSNNKEGMMNALIEFDRAVEKAVSFAEEDGNTLVIVTADHETGAITYNEELKSYSYTSGSHSSTDVPLRIYGSDKLVNNGDAVKNYKVSRYTAKVMGCTSYPRFKINPLFLIDVIKAVIKK